MKRKETTIVINCNNLLDSYKEAKRKHDHDVLFRSEVVQETDRRRLTKLEGEDFCVVGFLVLVFSATC